MNGPRKHRKPSINEHIQSFITSVRLLIISIFALFGLWLSAKLIIHLVRIL